MSQHIMSHVINLEYMVCYYHSLIAINSVPISSFNAFYYAPPLIGGGIKRCFCLTSDVCLSVCPSVAYLGPKSRTERPGKTKIGTELAHVTRDSRHHFQGQKVKGQGHQAALLSADLTA